MDKEMSLDGLLGIVYKPGIGRPLYLLEFGYISNG